MRSCEAAEFLDAAEPCYVNAQRLASTEMKWPYYLASLYKSKGDTVRAEASYRRALDLRPDDVPTLVWLARLELDLGKPDEARAHFSKALEVAPNTTAAQAGLGRVAPDEARLRRRPRATWNQALAQDPEAESLHAPLAAAYQGLGQKEQAAPHLRRWRNRDVSLPDPLQQELSLLLESALSYELRGLRAFESTPVGRGRIAVPERDDADRARYHPRAIARPQAGNGTLPSRRSGGCRGRSSPRW
jgi:tetratricopeptide (TPR) repeat protein